MSTHPLPSHIVAHIDGASRGNPGPAAYGVVLQTEDGRTLKALSKNLGQATNNVAEYHALLAALEFALEHHVPRLKVFSDSELLVRQVQGYYKVRSADLRPLHERARNAIAPLEAFSIQHVPRAENREADRLANLALDGMQDSQHQDTKAQSKELEKEAGGLQRSNGSLSSGEAEEAHHQDTKSQGKDPDEEARGIPTIRSHRGPIEPIPEGTNRIAREIVDAAFKVHSTLGPGLLESVYEACLVHELTKRGLAVKSQVELPVQYDGMTLPTALRLDLVVEDLIIVEVKAVESLLPVHTAQVLTYLKLTARRLGFLVNFNSVLIKDGIKRIAV